MSTIAAVLLGTTAAAGITGAVLWFRLRRCRQVQAGGAESAYLEQLFESAPEAIILADNDSRVIRVNSEFSRMFGYAAEEAIGKSVDELVAPGELKSEAEAVTHRVAQGRPVSFETVRRRKDGSRIQVSVHGTPVRFNGGQIAIYGIYRDVSQLKQTLARLQASEAKFSKAFRSSPGPATISTIEDGLVLEVNDAFVGVTGYSRADVIGRTTEEIGFWACPSDRERMLALLERDGTVRNQEYTFCIENGDLRTGLWNHRGWFLRS
jgi:PAS domain S-box-containing protein